MSDFYQRIRTYPPQRHQCQHFGPGPPPTTKRADVILEHSLNSLYTSQIVGADIVVKNILGRYCLTSKIKTLKVPDGQSESFQCTQLKKVINVKGDYSKIFSQVIPHELVKTIYNIYTFREELRKISGENQQVSRRGPRAHNCGAAVVT